MVVPQKGATVLLLLALGAVVVEGLVLPKRTFHGHSVLRIKANHNAHVEALRSLEDVHGINVDFWKSLKSVPGDAHLRVAAEDKEKVLSILKSEGLEHDVIIDNLQEKIDRENAELANRKVFKAGDHPSEIATDNYHNLDEILAYLDSVATTYPTLASTQSIGKSHQNRDLKLIKIGKPGTNKKAVFINGCQHAREWLGCATMVYIINELTTKQSTYDDLLTGLDIYILPVLNPDGYAYTWASDRMWRKTRSGPRSGCYGVDPNRNWNYKWNVAGASRNPCSETYDGPSANSEVETQAITSFLGANNKTLKAYFDIHTYSEDFMYSYGYADVYPVDVTKLKKVAGQATSAVNSAHGESFKYGSITDVIYPASGSSIDYAKGLLGIDYSYAMELRPDENSWDGFILPTSQILDGASECWAGVQLVFRAALTDTTD
uniref:Peptidase_M14 domain-containing protein n=1 Tax=Panagrellus redivivus TaxID=6233 RepID=A0A7E4V817_PANRE